ncbi:hypothetical protein WICMUC_005480 [Wickerhamomyces mucosus]|uniref:DNA-directed RNA polymerase III subunit RPC3 n=1 Tax=Wickerhamomyces mucosus TaxID=1378264 RepID=A0A9P8T560_9ASCO|nr:hypothetical protein WICMUC_005480 [Wickerhamomyces mucosus]
MSLPVSSKTQSSESFLYTGIVESFLGKRAALVISTLISYGRLNIKELSKRSSLSSVLVKKTLVSLIELGCISTWEEKTYKSEITYYSFREEGVLILHYSGEIIAHIDKTYSNDSTTQIVQSFLSLGNLTISEYIQSIGIEDKESIVNIEKCFTTLVNDKFLVPIQRTHFNSVEDIWLQTYRKAYSKIPKTSTLSELKRTAEAKSTARLEFLNILNFEPDTLFIMDKVTTYQKVNPNISLGFNFKRFLKSTRSSQLTKFCSHRVGKITSIIYKYALKVTEKNSPDVINLFHQIGITNEEIHNKAEYEPKPSQLFSAKDVLKVLPKEVILKETILNGPPKRRQSNDNQPPSSKRVKLENGYKIPEVDMGSDQDEDDVLDDNNDFVAIDAHLRILANSSVSFLKKTNSGLYYVPYPDVMSNLKRNVYDTVLSSTLGAPCARILRCVRDNRLVSEKLINSTALLKEKDARSLTAQLVKFNFLQIQEIPKSADRAASKSVFLFRINENHSSDFIKNNVCWNMGQQLEKISILRAENQALISKINRDDVKGKESQYLLPSEVTQLKELNEKELNFSIKIQRLASIWEVFKFY